MVVVGIDLASIARTSAAMSHSPEDTITVVSDADVSHLPQCQSDLMTDPCSS